jgi:hypothetical protein
MDVRDMAELATVTAEGMLGATPAESLAVTLVAEFAVGQSSAAAEFAAEQSPMAARFAAVVASTAAAGPTVAAGAGNERHA